MKKIKKISLYMSIERSKSIFSSIVIATTSTIYNHHMYRCGCNETRTKNRLRGKKTATFHTFENRFVKIKDEQLLIHNCYFIAFRSVSSFNAAFHSLQPHICGIQRNYQKNERKTKNTV